MRLITRLVFVCVVLCVIAAVNFCVAHGQITVESSPEWWKQLTPSERFALMQARRNNVIAERTNAISKIKREYLGRYPLAGFGITFDIVEKDEIAGVGNDSDTLIFGVKIVSVWKGSPADRAGIRPDDWLMKVDRVPICTVMFTFTDEKGPAVVRPPLLDTCLEMVADVFRIVSINDRAIFIEVERNGEPKIFTVSRRHDIGQEFTAYLKENLPFWENLLMGHDAFLEGLREKNRDESVPYSDFVQLQSIRETISEIMRHIAVAERSQIHKK